METVQREPELSCDMVFLFANETVLEFYPKFGFQRVGQYQYFWKPGHVETPAERGCRKRKLDMTSSRDISFLRTYYEKKNPFSEFQVTDNFGLLMFSCTSFMKDCVWYLEEEDAVILAEEDGDTLCCYEIYCDPGRKLTDLLERLVSERTAYVSLGFTPADQEGFEIRPVDDDDDALFVWTEKGNLFLDGKYLFPLLSHT